jgi:hypothetical protein
MTKKAAMPYARRFALATIVAAALAGCGSASSPTGSSDAEHRGLEVAAVRSPLLEVGDESRVSHGYIVKSSDPIYSKRAPNVVSYPTGRDNDEISETGAAPVRPCGLVSRSNAAAILGGAVLVSQEPQGPTCVFALRGSKRQVTLVIENTRLASLRGHARKASRVRVAGHLGWCLRYESTSVAVPLGDGRVLHVTGPCATAARFAARALPHVPR